MSESSRIAKNTVMLYFRQILIMLVSLYTVRIVLNVLGAEDYGIYNVVAGIVTMFSFLSNAMATASQRYFSFDLGKGDEEHLKTTFSVTFQIYLLLAIVVIFLAESIGLWFVNHRLVIPSDRIVAANWIFQAAIISFLLTLITTPYMSCIIAHENMNVYAYVSVIEVGLKLGIVFLLKLLPYDKLIIYGILLAIVSLIITSIYRIYCHKKYFECKFQFVNDGPLFREIVSYSFWNLFGAVAGVARNQGLTIILNLFFNPIIITARSISVQINATLSNFGNNFITAIKPVIIKDYACEKNDKIIKTSLFSSKIVFCLLALIVCPLFVKMDFLLNLWLKETPKFTDIFTKITILEVLIESLTYPIQIAIQATGKIKKYQIIVGTTLLLNLPISYLILHFYNNALVVFIVSFCLVIIANLLRIMIMKQFYDFNVISLLLTHLRTLIPILILLIIFEIIIIQIKECNVVISFLEIFGILLFTVFTELFICFSKSERQNIFLFIKTRKLV